MPARAGATLDFVPINHVAAGLVALAERIGDAAGGRFHLVSGEPVPIADWAAAIGFLSTFSTRRPMSSPMRSIPRRCRLLSAGSMAVSRGFTAAIFNARRASTIAAFER